MSSDHEDDRLISSAALTPRDSFLHRWSIADWAVTLLIIVFGMWADKAVPFSRQIGPQANDPTISYIHTPNAYARVPTSRLLQLAFYVPLAVLIVTILVCEAIADSNAAWLIHTPGCLQV